MAEIVVVLERQRRFSKVSLSGHDLQFIEMENLVQSAWGGGSVCLSLLS
jgi:hypothetical protein